MFYLTSEYISKIIPQLYYSRTQKEIKSKEELVTSIRRLLYGGELFHPEMPKSPAIVAGEELYPPLMITICNGANFTRRFYWGYANYERGHVGLFDGTHFDECFINFKEIEPILDALKKAPVYKIQDSMKRVEGFRFSYKQLRQKGIIILPSFDPEYADLFGYDYSRHLSA